MALVLLAVAVGAQTPGDPVADGFRETPPAARLRMFWRIFGPAWNRAEIDYQLDLLRQAGVGGVMACFTYPVALDDPAQGIHNDTFLSSSFLDTLSYAADRARQNDLEFGVCGGTGWPFGGPSVNALDAAQRLRVEAPALLPDRFGYVLPKLRDGERYLAAFQGQKDVTKAIVGDRLPASGDEPCRVFIVGPTYMKVKRAALGGEGYVVDHLSRSAAQRYLDAVVAPLLGAIHNAPLRSLFCDSLEVYNANWTHDLPEQFRHRRGYDLIPHLPDLFDDSSPAAPDLRFDLWRTVAELAEGEFMQTVHEFCRKHGVSFALEAYGTPSMGFTAARRCDVPWGEQYEWRGFSFSRFAASGGHLAGKKVIGAEAWTWAGIPNRLADSLSDLKLCSDLHFLAGENELTGVDFPYSPRSIPAPGWTPYYGPVINQNNPQWPSFHALAGYVNRCQWLLRQGDPVADVALYVPTEDAFAEGPPNQMALDFRLRDLLASGPLTDEFGLQKAFRHRSNVVSALLESGYNYDGIDLFAMNELAHAEHGEIRAGDGRYRIVVLPNLKGIDLAAMKKIALMCRQGGVVIATGRLPARTYGGHHETETPQLHALLTEMFGQEAITPRAGNPVTVHPYGAGRAILTANDDGALRQALAALATGDGRFDPDVRLRPLTSETDVASLCHVHRRVGNRDLYFLANVGERPARFTAEFRISARAVTEWDPLTGVITPRPTEPTKAHDLAHFTAVTLALPPCGSTFLCFAPGPSHPSTPAPNTPEETRTLTGAWHVTFDGPDAPAPLETPNLESWTTWPGARFFSGRATYECRFTLPAPLPAHCRLSFGHVYEAGEVAVNGHSVGTIWLPPYEIDITRCLQPGENRLTITVGNLPVNRVLGQPDPDLSALRAVYGERFPAPEERQLMAEPAPSGLIGPAILILQQNPK
jgi:hypothetical protein